MIGWIRTTGCRMAVLVALGAFSAAAQASPEQHPGRLLHRLDQAALGLSLDADTRLAIDGLLDAAADAAHAHREQMREARDVLHELLAAEVPDEEAVLAQADVLGVIQTSARKASLGTLLDVRALIPESERDAFQEAMAERAKGRRFSRDHGERRGGRGFGRR